MTIQEITQRNHINILGSGQKTMLFAHGYGCDQNMWRYITPEFQQNHKIVLFDHVGFGQSDWTHFEKNKYERLWGYAKDLIEICETLELPPITFVGHSVSATIGMLAAIEKPDLFKHLILIGASPCYINKAGYTGGFSEEEVHSLVDSLELNFHQWANFITPVIMGKEVQNQYTEELKNSFCAANPEAAILLAKTTFLSDYRDDFSKVSIPTLIIQTHPDAIAPREVGIFIHNKISHSKYVELNTIGHCPHLTAPKLVIEAIHHFIH